MGEPGPGERGALPTALPDLHVMRLICNVESVLTRPVFSVDQVLPLINEIERLRAAYRDEEERHAALQARCYEGFPSVSDGIFDEVMPLRRERAALDRLFAGGGHASLTRWTASRMGATGPSYSPYFVAQKQHSEAQGDTWLAAIEGLPALIPDEDAPDVQTPDTLDEE